MYETDVSKSNGKELERIGVKDIIGRPEPNTENPVDRLMTVALGDIKGLSMVTTMSRPVAIMWTEKEITLLSPSRTTFVIFRPEFSEGAQVLFEAEGRKEKGNGFFMPSYDVWEGECKPVRFAKKDMLTFLKLYALDCPPEIANAIKNLKMRQTKSESETISLDDESQKTVVEENVQTNIPKRFSIRMQITRDFVADVDFQATLKEPDPENYSSRNKGKSIELRVMNYRPILQSMMENYLKQLPEEIPRLYGSMRLGDAPNGRY